jgi:hypothetical protein
VESQPALHRAVFDVWMSGVFLLFLLGWDQDTTPSREFAFEINSLRTPHLVEER